VTADFAPRTAPRVAATAVVGLEAAVLAIAAVLYAVFAIVGDAESRGLSLGLAALAALAAVGLGFLARGLWHARRWAVSPSITWQVLQGFVGAFAIGADAVVAGVIAVVLAIVGAGALFMLARGESVSSAE